MNGLEEKSKEILELAYQVFQDEEYAKYLLENGIDVTNIEDYAAKYYEEYICNQMRR